MRTIEPDAASIELAGRRMFLGALAGVLLVSPRVDAATPAGQDPWPALAAQIFPDRLLRDGAALLTIDAPYRAEDAAVVPIALHTTLAADDPRHVRKITLVIDANPSPVAASFTLEPEAGIDRIATRVRVDDYTNVHAVAELSDGTLYAVARYVKASGGCSAPALKQTADSIPLGTLRFREFQGTGSGAAIQACGRPRSWCAIPTTRGCRWTRFHASTFPPTSCRCCASGRAIGSC